jgi:hypothetical protein
MVRLAIIDHDTHELFVETVSDEDIKKYGGEQEYIDDNYTFSGGYSWDYIIDAQYFGLGQSDPMEIDFEEYEEAYREMED